MNNIYCWPKFGKGIIGMGMGFGNRLLPWARCRIFSHLHQVQMISPVWIRPAIGQIFRGGIDYDSYLRQLILFGLFKTRCGDVRAISGYMKARGLCVVDELDNFQELNKFVVNNKDALIIFKGLKQYFKPLASWSIFLKNELVAITKKSYLDIANRYPDVPVGMCIRCGNDFDPCPTDRQILLPGEKTPIEWFVKTLQLIREKVGYSAACYIVSDGTSEQLKDLLYLQNVYHVRPGSAISDLLVMSKSRVLLASGSSSFAAWGAFLGQMPTASHPGQPMQKEWQIVPEKGQYLAEFDPNNPNQDFLEQCVLRIGM